MVIGRAVIVDLATGARLVRVLNVIAGVVLSQYGLLVLARTAYR